MAGNQSIADTILTHHDILDATSAGCLLNTVFNSPYRRCPYYCSDRANYNGSRSTSMRARIAYSTVMAVRIGLPAAVGLNHIYIYTQWRTSNSLRQF